MVFNYSTGAVASITPHGVKALRAILNDSVLDIMFYVSPRFGPEVRSYSILQTIIIIILY